MVLKRLVVSVDGAFRQTATKSRWGTYYHLLCMVYFPSACGGGKSPGGSPAYGCLSEESPQGAQDFRTQHHQVDDHDADQHHHGIALHLLGAFGGLFF